MSTTSRSVRSFSRRNDDDKRREREIGNKRRPLATRTSCNNERWWVPAVRVACTASLLEQMGPQIVWYTRLNIRHEDKYCPSAGFQVSDNFLFVYVGHSSCCIAHYDHCAGHRAQSFLSKRWIGSLSDRSWFSTGVPDGRSHLTVLWRHCRPSEPFLLNGLL